MMAIVNCILHWPPSFFASCWAAQPSAQKKPMYPHHNPNTQAAAFENEEPVTRARPMARTVNNQKKNGFRKIARECDALAGSKSLISSVGLSDADRFPVTRISSVRTT